MSGAIETVRAWLRRKKREREAREVRKLYEELQKYGTLRRDLRITKR